MADITDPTSAPPAEGAREQATHVASAATEQAAGVASSAKDQASAVASTAVEEAKAVASEATEEAKDLLADARQQLRSQANEQADKVASLVGDVAGQLRGMAAAGESGVAKEIVATVADQADQISQRMSAGGLDRTLGDARRLARNRPGLFLAGAALAGFVAARVARLADTASLKDAATSANRTNGPSGQPSPTTRPPGAAPLASTTPAAAMPAIEGPR